MAWRLVTHPEDLCSKVLKSKYFPKHKPLHSVARKKGTWVWKDITRGLEIVRKYHIWEVAKGQDIIIWQDNWVTMQSEPLVRPTEYHFQDYTQISQLIDIFSKERDDAALTELFTPTPIEKIKCIRLPYS